MMDIVEKLRESKLIRLTTGGGGEEVELPLHIEAADEIERLRGIINDDRLEGAADEIERLREALQNIAYGPRDVEKAYVSLLHEVRSEARKALGRE